MLTDAQVIVYTPSSKLWLHLPAMMTLQKHHVRFVPCDQSSLSRFATTGQVRFATTGQVRLRVGQSEQLVGGFYV